MTITQTSTPCDRVDAASAIDQASAESMAVAVKALADPLRLRMLSLIASSAAGEACACDLAALADVSQPTVSHHLKVLRDAGVLTSERRGTWVYYRLEPAMRPVATALVDGLRAALHADERPSWHPGQGDRQPVEVDAKLSRLAARLAEATPDLSGDAVLRIVRESHAGLARASTVHSHLLVLAERFAQQRIADVLHDRTAGVPHVLFVCVQNAGRSQLAAALVEQRSGGRVVARSAGSMPAADVHPEVRALIDELGVDGDPFPKPLTDDAVRAADVVITMGCGDVCPIIPGVRYEDWQVGDPALASPAGVRAIRDDLARRVEHLLAELSPTA
ncbi:metalloregulator ArsR/SmtB family transcription factor [Agrococcus sp. ARC_14]|uniref:metalloregulator ArsR/SmtB family transcription factor n=1 Tax=Agrococcus sp. ARC_14 TaxID=2919927 RepID=UPI001F0542E9|nr:metalloregulator ArsR/SmtB family transcription factor [Agrococcus sp. ARC_14]MCH1883507.1 metalloregulator ArsR/SmtB family transcription factor [Agrococcus sp. ARC_14]